MSFARRYFGVIAVFLLAFPSILPLFQPGFFPMHDDTQVARVYEMGKALSDGMLPVRWTQDLGYGYGYPIFNFYAPLPYYVGGFLTVVGIDALFATKVMFVLGILLSGFSMYLLAREFWGEAGGMINSLVYMYVPYHAVQMYVRGAVGEFWAYAFLPLMFMGLYKIFELSNKELGLAHEISNIKNQRLKIKIKNQKEIWKWIIVTAVGFAGVILSHNLTAMMSVPFVLIVLFIACYVAFKHQNLSVIYHVICIILLGLAISAFYWLPALMEMQYTNVASQLGGGADYKEHFVCFSQLWESMWGYGGSAPGCVDGMSFKLGKLNIVLFLASLVLFISRFLKVNQVARLFHRSGGEGGESAARDFYRKFAFIFLFSISGFFLSVFFMLEQSRIIWNVIPFAAFIQYPWRFLNFAGFFMSVAIGSIFYGRWNLDRRFHLGKNAVFALFFIMLTLLFNAKLFHPQTYYDRDSNFYTSENNIKWTASKISDEYMPSSFRKPIAEAELPKQIVDMVSGRGTIEQVEKKTGKLRVRVDAQDTVVMRLNIAYFPAWKIFVNGKESEFERKEDGLYIQLPQGISFIEAVFVQTTVESISNVISIVSILGVFVGIIPSIYLRKYGKKAS